VIDRIHDGEADEQLHDTLKREALIPVDAREARRVRGADPDPSVDPAREAIEFLLKCLMLERGGEAQLTTTTACRLRVAEMKEGQNIPVIRWSRD
jgi:hypothetical protein